MQNAMHVGNVTSPLHFNNKVLINTVSQINDKRDQNQIQKPEQLNHVPFGTTPISHVTTVNHTSSSIIQSGTKSVMCNIQDAPRSQPSNVIHTLNSQRLTTGSLSNIIQIEANKSQPSVLSVATIRPTTVLTKIDSPTVVTTTSITNASSLLLKTSSTGSIRPINKIEQVDKEPQTLQNKSSENEKKVVDDMLKHSSIGRDIPDKQTTEINQSVVIPLEQNVSKCETDFEELLKDNTNEIKVTNDPEKKLEVNVGKTVTLLTTSNICQEKQKAMETICKDERDIEPLKPQEITLGKKEEINNQLNSDIIKTVIADKVDSVIESSPKHTEVNHININNPNTDDNTNKTIVEDRDFPYKLSNITKTSEIIKSLPTDVESNENQIKSLDENDSWSAKDVNIESVIKKVDSLCGDLIENNQKTRENEFIEKDNYAKVETVSKSSIEISTKLNSDNLPMETVIDDSIAEEVIIDSTVPSISKRGGRSVRGKKADKNQDRIQTRQITKPSRGGGTSKRGRGRAKVDKKIKTIVNSNATTMPGDVYDFHEDSGDEATGSPTKAEPRPRLILTIKSPLSGHANMTATSSLSITPKEPIKNTERLTKDEKHEDLISPSPNTRKSRRLQEKDVQRSTVDDVIEDVVKGTGALARGRESVRRRPARSVRVGPDTRKSPRGVKRTRDRSVDTAADSGDEPLERRDEATRDAKTPRLEDRIVHPPVDIPPARPQPQQHVAPATVPPTTPIISPTPSTPIVPAIPAVSVGPIVPPVAAVPTVPIAPTVPTVPTGPSVASSAAPTPIIKPPKKMISEISAKLACAFEASASVEAAERAPAAAEPERLDSVPGAMMPVGATEATDARVQSPALPHRPPSAHRVADRATPVLIRNGEGAEAVNVGGGSGVGARGYRAYGGAASLPRGAAQPEHPHLKQVAVVGPHHHHHHHPGAASRVTITSVPSISPQGQMALGEGMYPHFSHQHYQMYQQHFRATQQECRTTPSPYTRSLEAEGCEAPTPELRRPLSARVPRPAHSPSHGDRLIMYAVGCGRSPPPAHGTSRLAGALPPSPAPGPPHASQVPREADSLQMLLRRYPVMWQGLLALKNDSAAVQMHFVGGNPGVAGDTLARHGDHSTPLLRIAQRMRLEPAQLDQVHRKMKMENEHCMLLALPCGRDHMDVLQQSTNLTAGFITYLQRKQAAGIVNIAPPGHQQAVYTVHIFPSCDFANENLNRIAPDLMHRVADIAHLLIVIATV